MSKFSSTSGVKEKIEFLQRAEESYYRHKTPDKKNSSLHNRAISEALRQASKQRLFNALKQAQQRLGNLKIELDASANFLENECYKKYGKVGRTFYNSQMASTIRWLSKSSSQEITDRLGTNANQDSRASSSDSLPADPSLFSVDSKEQFQGSIEAITGRSHGNVTSETSLSAAQTKISNQGIELPPIPSFSELVSRKADDGRSNPPSKSTNHFPGQVKRDQEEKRMRLQ